MSREKTIQVRQFKLKSLFLEQLKKTPTIEQACQKIGVSRMTISRWRNESRRFDQAVHTAQVEGREFVSDIAEAQMFNLISQGKVEMIKYFLSHNNERYANKLELSGSVLTKDEPLTSEQKTLIREALKLSSIQYNEKIKEIQDAKKEK